MSLKTVHKGPSVLRLLHNLYQGFSDDTQRPLGQNVRLDDLARATIYTAPQCPHSNRLKEFLAEHNIDFEERCVLTSPETFSELEEATGQKAIPALVVDGESFIGFDSRAQRRIKRKFGV